MTKNDEPTNDCANEFSNGWLSSLNWDENGLIPAIAQDAASGRVVMFAWMNKAALQETVTTRQAVYWSRSRQRLWRKGEESGHVQKVIDIWSDCDQDVLLLSIEQVGGIACHTGRESCFFNHLEENNWVISAPIIKDPKDIYQK